MAIAFSPDRWDKLKTTYSLWWEGKLDRPITGAELSGRDPGRLKPDVPLISQKNCNDFSISAADIVDRLDYELSCKVYMGDAYPYVNMNFFGPGVVAALLGADLDNSSGRVWFFPKEKKHISELHFEYDPDNILLKRVKDICKEAMSRWQGQVLLGMPDLGGVLDILATFRSSEELLMDLYDYPEEVKSRIKEIHEMWFKFYDEINSILQPYNPGYSDWSGIYSDIPSYILQSDFSYMIGPAMFDEFTKPDLEASCKRLARSTYHLDGAGQLAHLDSLLNIKELGCVQWVPGGGSPPQTCWPEVYKKIIMAGKNTQIGGDFDALDTIAEQLGTRKGIQQVPLKRKIAEENDIRKKLEEYGIE